MEKTYAGKQFNPGDLRNVFLEVRRFKHNLPELRVKANLTWTEANNNLQKAKSN